MIGEIERDKCLADRASDLIAFWATATLVGSLHLVQKVGSAGSTAQQMPPIYQLMVGGALLWSLSLGLAGAYCYPVTIRREFVALLKGGVFCGALILSLAPAGWLSISRTEFLVCISLSVPVALLFRTFATRALLRLTGHRKNMRVLIVGNSANAEHVADLFRFRNGYELRLWKGAVEANGTSQNGDGAQAFRADLKEYEPAEVVFVGGKGLQANPKHFFQACQELEIPWQLVPDIEHPELLNIQTHVVGGIPLIASKGSAFNGLNLRVKQFTDLALGTILLVFTAPIMAIVWVVIRLNSKGPAIIVQPRLGYKGKIFNIYKFRTMYHSVNDAAHRAYVQQCIKGEPYGDDTRVRAKTFKIVDDKRVTNVGRILRRYSLDELPQLFNVLKLEMSLVGPRPSLAYELESYQEWHKERLEAVPGLTGLWQISGRSLLSFNEMVRLDLEYLRNWTLIQDFRLIIKTIPAIFRGTGL